LIASLSVLHLNQPNPLFMNNHRNLFRRKYHLQGPTGTFPKEPGFWYGLANFISGRAPSECEKIGMRAFRSHFFLFQLGKTRVVAFRGNWSYTALKYQANLHIMDIFLLSHDSSAKTGTLTNQI
jgi:hypothetical protein